MMEWKRYKVALQWYCIYTVTPLHQRMFKCSEIFILFQYLPLHTVSVRSVIPFFHNSMYSMSFRLKSWRRKKPFLQPEVGKSTTLWRFWFSHFHMKIWCFTCKIIFRPFFHGMPVHMAQIYTDLFLNVKEYVNILYIKRHPTPQQFDIIRYQSFILIASLLSKFRTLQNITKKLILIEFIYILYIVGVGSCIFKTSTSAFALINYK